MFILDNPLMYFIFSLVLLALLMIFFKILNYLETKPKTKPKEKKFNEKTSKIKEEKQEDVKEEKQEEIITNKDIVYSGENYLYDRFVTNPTEDDCVNTNLYSNNPFITEEEYTEIRNKKVKIQVKELKNEELSSKLDRAINHNSKEKEKLLNEFNNLSKQMKLLLIENIINKN